MRSIAVRLVSLLAFCASMAAQGASTITYYHNDLLGSPVVATNASGQVIWRESYRPFGERLTNSAASAKNDVWFAGRRQDVDTGLVYMGARFYDPVLGRFLSKDPVGFVESDLHSFNRYAYANNNPYRYVDPNGRWAQFAIRIEYALVYEGATALGAATLGSAIGRGLWNVLHEEEGTAEGKEADGGDKGADGQDVKKRPSRVRKGTEQSNWNDADDGDDGGKLCPTCGKEVSSKPGQKGKDWDNDHEPAWRDRDLTGKDRKDVLDEYNRGTRLRCVGCNRSDNGN